MKRELQRKDIAWQVAYIKMLSPVVLLAKPPCVKALELEGAVGSATWPGNG